MRASKQLIAGLHWVSEDSEGKAVKISLEQESHSILGGALSLNLATESGLYFIDSGEPLRS